MKKIIRCKKCVNRIVISTCGFIKTNDLRCTHFDISVVPDDGCTFGEEGDPIHKACREYEVIIQDHAAVMGFHNEEEEY